MYSAQHICATPHDHLAGLEIVYSHKFPCSELVRWDFRISSSGAPQGQEDWQEDFGCRPPCLPTNQLTLCR